MASRADASPGACFFSHPVAQPADSAAGARLVSATLVSATDAASSNTRLVRTSSASMRIRSAFDQAAGGAHDPARLPEPRSLDAVADAAGVGEARLTHAPGEVVPDGLLGLLGQPVVLLADLDDGEQHWKKPSILSL